MGRRLRRGTGLAVHRRGAGPGGVRGRRVDLRGRQARRGAGPRARSGLARPEGGSHVLLGGRWPSTATPSRTAGRAARQEDHDDRLGAIRARRAALGTRQARRGESARRDRSGRHKAVGRQHYPRNAGRSHRIPPQRTFSWQYPLLAAEPAACRALMAKDNVAAESMALLLSLRACGGPKAIEPATTLGYCIRGAEPHPRWGGRAASGERVVARLPSPLRRADHAPAGPLYHVPRQLVAPEFGDEVPVAV